MEDWIKEYTELLFPIDGQEKRIREAQKIKAKHTPQKLYKFRSVKKYTIANLENDELTLTEASELNDPFECSFVIMKSKDYIEQLRGVVFNDYKKTARFSDDEKAYLNECSTENFFKKIEERSPAFSKTPQGTLLKSTETLLADLCEKANEVLSQKNPKSIYLCSLSENKESSSMWAHYADDFKGFCIEYDFRKIIGESLWCELQPVIYQSEIPDFSRYAQMPLDHLNNLISIYASMIKSTDWACEKEWRITFPFGKQPKPYMQVKAPKPTALFLGMMISPHNQKRIINIAKSKEIPVYKMLNPKDSFRVEYKRIL